MPDSVESFFTPLNTFALGVIFGGIFLVLSLFSHWKTKREFKRYQRHLSDKLELDSRNIQELNKERARLSQESEHLRLQVARLNEKPDNKLHRELEIFARAEKHMMINAPGFAPAWEMAKSQALGQLETEEKGLSFPQKIFRKLLGPSSGGGQPVAIAETAVASNGHGKSETANQEH